MQNQKIKSAFFITLLVVSFALFLLILKPYVGIIIAAGALAIVFKPLHNKILKLARQRTIASLISVFIVVLIVLIPLFFIGLQVFQEASSVYSALAANQWQSANALLSGWQSKIQKIAPNFSWQINLQETISPALDFTIKHLGGLFSGAAKILLALTLGLISLFYFLREGKEFKKYLSALSPLPDKNDQEIFTSLKNTVNAAIKGSLLIAVLQGILAGLGFFVVGISNAALWGSIAFLAALIPGFSTAIVIGPAVIYLLVAGKTISGLGLLIWGLAAVGLIDNFLSPKLIKRGSKIHPFLVLLSVLGGISVFGPMGILIGPMIVSLFIALVKIYQETLAKGKT